MRSLNKGAALILGCFIVTLVILAPSYLRGDDWNLATKFEVNHPFQVPGMELQPNTPYVIKILESPGARNVVQVWNEDQQEMLTMFMGISSERDEAEDNTVFTFIESQPGVPLPIKEWFYPGRLTGLEFVYPKDQALKIAAHAREPVLATDSVDLHELSSITVEAIEPIGDRDSTAVARTAEGPSVERAPEEPAVVEQEQAAIVEQEQPVVEQEQAAVVEQEQPAVQEQEQEVQIAQNEQPEVQREPIQEAEQAPAVSDDDASEELPATAGELPLVALIGVLCLGAGLGLRVLSTRS
jgi:hypothetical protein